MAAQHHHGRTPAAWTGAIIAFIGFCVAGAFTVAAKPVGFWVGIGVIALGAVVGGLMSVSGMGAHHEPLRRVGASKSAQSDDSAREHANA